MRIRVKLTCMLFCNFFYFPSRENWENNYHPSSAFKGTSGGQAICFSACEDYQQAADTSVRFSFSQGKWSCGSPSHKKREERMRLNFLSYSWMNIAMMICLIELSGYSSNNADILS